MRTIIRNVSLFANDDARNEYDRAAILVEDGRIAEIYPGGADEAERQWMAIKNCENLYDGKGMLAVPAFVNAHTHLFQCFMRGLGEGLPLYSWISRVIWPTAVSMEPEDFYYAAMLGCVEALKGGTGTVVDNHYTNGAGLQSDFVCEAMRDSGIRGVLARGYADRYYHPQILETPEVIHHEMERLVKKWHGSSSGRLQVSPSPLSPVRCTAETLRWTGDFARENDLMIHIHTAETETIVNETVELYGMRNIPFLKSVNMLQARSNLVHSVIVNEDEAALIAEAGATVVHCPVSNLYLGSGISPVPLYQELGINIAAGSDGPASNNTQNMFETLKWAACLHRGVQKDANCVSAQQALDYVTRGGGRGIGQPELGSLEAGKPADIVLLNLNKAHNQPLHSRLATLVYSAGAEDVDTVFVAGRALVAGGKALFVDEDALLEECRRRITRAVKRSESLAGEL